MDRKMEPEMTTRTNEPGIENTTKNYQTRYLQNFDVFKVENVLVMPLKRFLDTPGPETRYHESAKTVNFEF